MARKKPVRKASTEAVNAGFSSLDVQRMSNADLVKPPSAVKRRGASKASREALAKHEGKAAVTHTNRKDPKAKKPVVTDFSRMPTREQQAGNEYMRVAGERIDIKLKGEMVLVNASGRAGGAGVLFNRGQIGKRELGAAAKVCELAERARASQLSGMQMGERVDGGKIDLDGARLRSAAMAAGELREALALLSRQGRVLVEKCIVGGMSLESAVRVRPLAEWLGDDTTLRHRCKKAVVLLRDALDRLADAFHLPEA